MNIKKLDTQQKDLLLDSINEYFVTAGFTDDHFESFDELLEKYSDGILHLAYTTYGEDEQFDIQIDFNLNNMRYEEYIDDELYINPNEVYDRSFEEFCNEISACDFDNMIHTCALECINREENPEIKYQRFNNLVGDEEYIRALWVIIKNDLSIDDIYSNKNIYNKEIVDEFYKTHDLPNHDDWTNFIETINKDIGGISDFVEKLNISKDKNVSVKDNLKSKSK